MANNQPTPARSSAPLAEPPQSRWPRWAQMPGWLAYALAVVLTLATLLVRLALGFAIDDPLLELFLIPIMLSAYVGGLAPGLVATALAAACATYFIAPPDDPFAISSRLLSAEWGLLIIMGILISGLNEALHRARRRAEASRRLQLLTLASIGDAVITTDTHARVTFLNAEAERLTGWAAAEAIGQPLAAVFQLVDEQTRARVDDPAAKVLRTQLVVGLANHTVLIARDGRETPIDDSGAPIRSSSGALQGVVLVFRDVSSQKQAEAALGRAAERLRVLADASRAFAEAGVDYQGLLDQVAQTITAGLGEGCIIRLLAEDGIWVPVAVIYDLEPDMLELTRIVLGEVPLRTDELSLTTQIIKTGQPLLLSVVDKERARAATKPEYWSLSERLGVHSMIAVPMRVQGQTIGVLTIYRRRPDRSSFDRDDLQLTQDLADRAALAIGNTRLLAQVRHELAERTRAQAQLRYQADLLAQVSDAIISIDRSFTITSWNAAAEALYGWPAQEVIGKPMSQIVPTTYREGDSQLARARLLAEGSWRGEVTQERRDGTKVPILSGVSVLRDADGAPAGAVAVNRDITDRTRAEAALRQSEARFAAAFRASPAALAITRASDAHIIDVNASFLLLHEYRREEVIGHSAQDLRIFADPGKFAALARALRETGVVHNRELAIRTKAGELRQVLFSIEAIEIDGEACFLTLLFDITDRTRAEAALQHYTERLQHLRAIDQAMLASRSLAEIAEAAVTHIVHLLPATRVGVMMLDPETQILTSLALYMHGELHRSPNLHAPLALFAPALEPLTHGQEYQVADVAALPEPPAFIRVGQIEDMRAYFHMPIMARSELVALLNVGANQPGAFTAEHLEIGREVANQLSIAIQQARLRSQVDRYAQELEQRVADRTAELTAANSELEAFSYSVSHDLRAPLRAIDGFSRILLEDYIADLPDEAQSYFQLLRSNAQQMGQLVDDLLAFSRLGRQPLSRRASDPAALARQCLDELGGEQAGRRVAITIGELPSCQADPALLKQVWFNLLANALKYTRRREQAQIEIGSRTADGETVYFVRDNGVGFDMRYSDKLFGVFQRMHRAEDYEGTGVGLAIVQRIIQRHGGRIWADAAVDRGATFYFTLE